MRLTVRLLGVEVFHVSTEEDVAWEDEGDALNGGTLGAMPMGFVAQMDRPHEIDTPDRDW